MRTWNAKLIAGLAATLVLAVPGWAQRGRGGMRGAGVAFAAPRGMGRVATPSFGRTRFAPFRNGFRHGFIGRRGFVSPVWWGGGLYWDTWPYDYDESYYSDETQAYGSYGTPPAQVIVIQLPPAAAAQPAANESQALPALQEPDVGQLFLVRRDGQVVLVSAFTITGGQVTYVTPQGTRRSFAVQELDKRATREKNDENGTSVALPG